MRSVVRMSDLMNLQPKQIEALQAIYKYRFILYGGAAGGGKSYFGAKWLPYHAILCFLMYGVRNARVMLGCETYTMLQDRHLCHIDEWYPSWLGVYHEKHNKYQRCFIINEQYGGGVICYRNLDDPDKYLSSEWLAVFIDELTMSPLNVFQVLAAQRLRWPGIPHDMCKFLGGTNPLGKHAAWVKSYWIDKHFPKNIIEKGLNKQFKFIPALLSDNKYLSDDYADSLLLMGEKKANAYLRGEWENISGQAFPELTRDSHGIDEMEACGAYNELIPIGDSAYAEVPRSVNIPYGCEIIMGYDWGFYDPFSIGWFYINREGQTILFAEWYGWNSTPDEGVCISDSQVAQYILHLEQVMGITGRVNMRIADTQCFGRRSDTIRGGEAPSTAEMFRQYGLALMPASKNRQSGIRTVREYFQIKPLPMNVILNKLKDIQIEQVDENLYRDYDGQEYTKYEILEVAKDQGIDINESKPKFMASLGCAQFWRTLTSLSIDPTDGEDVLKKGAEDHVYDMLRYVLHTRYNPIELKIVEETPAQKYVREAMEPSRIDDSFFDEDDYGIVYN